MKIDSIQNGIVLDHITAGKAMQIYYDLGLDKLDCSVALIQRVKSGKMGKKDIIKVDKEDYDIDLDVIGYIDPNITVSIIKDGETIEKKKVDLPKKLINIRVRDDEDFVRIEIEDNGKGIANKDIPYIFDRFYRTDSSRNSSTGGSGIGLSIVKKIVEDHGGRIWASSREGFGTTMTIEMRKYKEVQHEQNTDRGRREGYRRT